MAKRKPITRNTAERIRRARFLKDMRFYERKSFRNNAKEDPDYQTLGGINEVHGLFGVNLNDVARQLLQREKRPLSFLDLGAGQGITGLELQDNLGRANINTYAISLARPFSRKGIEGKKLQSNYPNARSRFASFRVGEYERKNRAFFGKRRFDIISSTVMSLHVNDIVRIASRLTPRGIALCILETDQLGDFTQVKKTMNHKGFDIRLHDVLKRAHSDKNRALLLLKVKHHQASTSA